jgi:trehalose synthase-fused probable maltokinase
VIEDLRAARWFGGKSRAIVDTRVLDCAALTRGASVCFVEVQYEYAAPEMYVLADHLEEPLVAQALLERFAGGTLSSEQGGSLRFEPTHLFASVDLKRAQPVALMRGEQSNTSIRFGNHLMLKLFRRLQFGPNPEVEVGRFLTDETSFRNAPAVLGSLTYRAPDDREASLALLQTFESNRGDAWTTTLQRLGPLLDGGSATESMEMMARLGRTTAELHVALASGTGDFSSEPILKSDIETWRRALEEEVETATDALARKHIDVDQEQLLQRADGIAALEGALKTRHHGDYHLGQVLEREDGSFVVIDFEGEPSKPLALRREKRSPLRDVAGMLRSFDYARNAALRAGDAADGRRVRAAAHWYSSVRESFLSAYCETIGREAPALLPRETMPPLVALELEKAAYEVLYELNNRPDWLPIPLAALTSG